MLLLALAMAEMAPIAATGDLAGLAVPAAAPADATGAAPAIPPATQAKPDLLPAATVRDATVPAATVVAPTALPVDAAPATSESVGPLVAAHPAMTIDSAAPVNSASQPRDPFIKTNRGIFSFDTKLDHVVLAPIAHGYVAVVPKPIRFHLTNALYNINEPITVANDLMQLRLHSMSKAVARFVINSTLGIGGLFDVATATGIPRHHSDFGQTLGRYGARPGPYLVLPLLGPSGLRDAFGLLVDNFLDPFSFVLGGLTSTYGISRLAFEPVDLRARSDDAFNAVYSATDPYATARSAFTQYRASVVQEATGKAPDLPDFDAAPGKP
jgi:phospholipid-binding lipoprotein MlaA